MNFKYLPVALPTAYLLMVIVFLGAVTTLSYAENSRQAAEKSLEAWELAQDYSLAHPVVAFAVYGRIKDATARDIGEKITSVLASHNIKSKYFLAKEHRIGSSLGFYLQGVSYGPVGFDKVLPLIRQVIEHYKQEYFLEQS